MRSVLFLSTYTFLILLFLSCKNVNGEKLAQEDDTLTYSYKLSTYSKSIKDTEDTTKLFQSQIIYPEIIFDKNEALRDSVESFIVYSVFRGFQTPDEANKAFVEESIQQTQNLDGFCTSGWESSDSIAVVTNTSGILCLKVNHYSYTGGAHGNPFETYVNFRTSDSRRLDFKTIINQGQMSSLKEANIRHLKKLRHIAKGTSLEDAGLFVKGDDLPLPASFALTKSGLIMSYNYYEIAPYSDGVICYTIPFEELRGIIHEDYYIK